MRCGARFAGWSKALRDNIRGREKNGNASWQHYFLSGFSEGLDSR